MKCKRLKFRHTYVCSFVSAAEGTQTVSALEIENKTLQSHWTKQQNNGEIAHGADVNYTTMKSEKVSALNIEKRKNQQIVLLML